MPFKSKAQQRKCYALKAQGKAKGWDCSEWSDKTDFENLPEKKSKKKKNNDNKKESNMKTKVPPISMKTAGFMEGLMNTPGGLDLANTPGVDPNKEVSPGDATDGRNLASRFDIKPDPESLSNDPKDIEKAMKKLNVGIARVTNELLELQKVMNEARMGDTGNTSMTRTHQIDVDRI